MLLLDPLDPPGYRRGAGGLLKYLRDHPIPRLTLAGGFGKFAKLAAGHLDLHSGRSRVDPDWLADRLAALGAAPELVARARAARTANEILALARPAGLPLADAIARRARKVAQDVVGEQVAIEVVIFDRQGALVGRDDV